MQTSQPPRIQAIERREVYRPYTRIRAYLADYIVDRALVHTDYHRHQVDRIYAADPIVTSWSVRWDEATHTPYAYRKDRFVFPADLPAFITDDIIRRHAHI